MKGVSARFTLRTLARNRVRTAVTVAGVALSAALLAAVLTSVASVQAGMAERTRATEGSWHAFSSEVSASAVDALADSGWVSDLAAFSNGGAAALSEADALSLGDFLTLKSLPETVKGSSEPDGAPLSLMPELSEGRMPETADEVVLPDYYQGETLGADGEGDVSSDGPLEVGSVLKAKLGARTTLEDGEEAVVDARPRTLTVTGFYERQPPFVGNNYTAENSSAVALNAAGSPAGVSDADGEPSMGVYATTQGVGSVGEMARLFQEATGSQDADALFHGSLLQYLGVSDGRPIWGTLWMLAGVLAAVIVAASVSLIYNAFSISVAERTRQFGLLASVGASKRQLRRMVLFEALLIGAVGVPLGLAVGVAGTAGVFAVSQGAFAALLGEGFTGLAVRADAGALAAAAALSFATLAISAWAPSARAARVSAVEAIRQTQDVRLSRRGAREASSKRRDAGPSVRIGLAGRLFGASGFVAHRNLSRAAARGRTVVASLAVSVALVVVSGSVALYLSPLSDRASSRNAAGSEADIVVSAYPERTGSREGSELSDHAAEFDGFLARAAELDGVRLSGTCRQGQAESVVGADMLSEEARAARESFDEQTSEEWVPSSFGADGTFYGLLCIFYLDDASWRALVGGLGLDEAAYTDPDHPRAIGLNTYQATMPDGTYISAKPFARTGSVDLYAIEGREGFSHMGVQEGPNGQVLVGYLDQEAASEGDPSIVTAPAAEAAQVLSIEIGALCDEEPAVVNAISGSFQFPAVILPESVAASAAGAGQYPENPFAYSFAGASFTADDHAKAAKALEELASGCEGLVINVTDVEASAQQGRLVAQAVQLFALCFSAITALIAVANVFNTLANGIILRTREFAVLRSVGMGGRAFARMMGYECASYAVRGLGIGLLVALAATWGLHAAVGMAFAGVAFDLPWEYLAAAVVLVLAVLALSVAYALRRARAGSIAEALRADAL